MKFDAVIFDLYGTLVDSVDSPGGARAAYDAVTAKAAEALGAPLEAFLLRWRATFNQRMSGQYPSYEAYVTSICRDVGVTPTPEQVEEALRLRVELFQRHLVPRPDAVETLVTLRAMGHKIGLISDCSWETPHLWPATSLAPCFDVTTFSCATGTRKPDPRIFTMTCEELGVMPEGCLYVGDGGSDELAGAERVGMTALRIHVPYETLPDHADPWPGPEVSTLAQTLEWVT